jgi:hypothetical protein
MDINHEPEASDNFSTTRLAWARRRFAEAFIIAVVLGAAVPTMTTAGEDDVLAAPTAEATAGEASLANSHPTTPSTQMSSHRDSVLPDGVAEYVGGIAARVHTAEGAPIAGDLFLLMATPGSNRTARLYDQTPFTHTNGPHSDTNESNRVAADVIEAVTGVDLALRDFTSAPGGGNSGGITYAIAYLNLVSNGAFTNELSVAATGELEPLGYVHPINGINEKTAAAHLAGAEVLFTPSIPTAETIDAHGDRVVGELFRARDTGATLADERVLDSYRRWGTHRPEDAMDIVGVRHFGDVAAYLCGTGSAYACEIRDLLDDTIIDRSTNTEHHDRPESAHKIEGPSQLH